MRFGPAMLQMNRYIFLLVKVPLIPALMIAFVTARRGLANSIGRKDRLQAASRLFVSTESVRALKASLGSTLRLNRFLIDQAQCVRCSPLRIPAPRQDPRLNSFH